MLGIGQLNGFMSGNALQKFDIVLSNTGLVSYSTDPNSPAMPASGSITLGPYAGAVVRLQDEPTTITVNGVTFTYTGSNNTGNNIAVGANVNATATKTADKLNASTDPLVSVATYSVSQPYISFAPQNVITVTHDTLGTAGNSFTLATNSTKAVVSGPTLAGGTVATSKYIGQYMNVHVPTILSSMGWLGVRPVLVNLRINSGVYIGNLLGSFALDTGILPPGSRLFIENYGYVLGFGGRGGDCPWTYSQGNNGSSGGTSLIIRSGYYVEIYNMGVIAGGGGGGGSGGIGTCGQCYDDTGGGGGGGAGLPSGDGGNVDQINNVYAHKNPLYFNGKIGGVLLGGKGGIPTNISGNSAEWQNGSEAGDGGAIGMIGNNGKTINLAGNSNTYGPGLGGNPGIAVQGYNNAVWTSFGTITGQIL